MLTLLYPLNILYMYNNVYTLFKSAPYLCPLKCYGRPWNFTRPTFYTFPSSISYNSNRRITPRKLNSYVLVDHFTLLKSALYPAVRVRVSRCSIFPGSGDAPWRVDFTPPGKATAPDVIESPFRSVPADSCR